MDSVLTDMVRVGFKPAAESKKKGGKNYEKEADQRILCVAMAVTLVAGCGAPAAETGGNEEGSSSETVSEGIPKDEIKVGFVHVSDRVIWDTHTIRIWETQEMQEALGFK